MQGSTVILEPKKRPVTVGIAGLITLCSLVYVWLPSYRSHMTFLTIETGERHWTALLTNGFVCLGSSPLNLMLLLGLVGYFNQAAVQSMWRRFRWRLVGFGVAAFIFIHVFQAYLFAGMGWGYMSEILVALWLGGTLEQRWGHARLGWFSLIVTVIPQIAGFSFGGIFDVNSTSIGAHPLFNGWMTALCLMHGRHLIPGVNIKTIHLVWLLVILDGLALVLDGSLGGAMGLSGTGTAWLLVSGRWRPERLILGLRAAINGVRQRQRRRRFRIIPGDKD